MNTNAVCESVRLLPPDSPAYRANLVGYNSTSKHRTLGTHDRWSEAANDPAWGWCIAYSHHQVNEALPASIRDQNIRRAYWYLKGHRDEQMAMALGIRTSLHYGNTRAVLQGLLCARDISHEGIANLLGLEPEVVRLFEGLFFNIRGREGSFAMNQVFPQSRIGAVAEADKDYDEVDLMLMRSGRDYGWKEVARLAGLRTMEDENESSETMLAEMERTMAANARMLARAGHLNRKESPGIRHGKTLMMRPKPEAVRQQTDDDRLGLGSFGMRAPVLEHFRRITDVDTQYRMALQRQQAMREQDAEAKKAGEQS